MQKWINVPDGNREQLLEKMLFDDCAIGADGVYAESSDAPYIVRFPLEPGEQVYVCRKDGKLKLTLTKAISSGSESAARTK